MESKSTPNEVLEGLKAGNAKHVKAFAAKAKGTQKDTKFEIEQAVPGQEPYAAILGCADSRVIPERIFGAKEGDLFVVRVAGNVAAPDVIASLEYAVEHLYVKAILVLGHEDCGAVKATLDFVQKRQNLGYNLNNLVSYIVPAVNDPQQNDPTLAIKSNACLSACGILERSKILHEYHCQGKIWIGAAYYHISTEEVEFLNCPPCV
jgi:carbonic anhydrase